MSSEVQKMLILMALVVVIATSTYFAIGQPYKEERFEVYLGICTRAGHTPEQCLFAKQYRREAAALRGN